MPDFYALTEQLRHLRDAGLQDTPTYRRLGDLAMQCAPPEAISQIMQRAVKEGWLPPPSGVTPNGQRVWNLNDIAAHFGHTEAEAQALLAEFQQQQGVDGIVDPTTVSPLH